jgi:hypothetical protein
VQRPPIPVIAFLGTLAFAGAGYGSYQLVLDMREAPPPAAAAAPAPWIEQHLGSSLVFEAPVQLKLENIELAANVKPLVSSSSYLTGEANGLSIAATAFTYREASSINLDAAADGAIANIRALPGTQLLEPTKTPATVAGEQAIELGARVKRDSGQMLRVHGAVLAHGSELFIFMLIASADPPATTESWQRLRQSIHLAH